MAALHPDIHASLKSLSQELGITSRYLSQTKFLLDIPFCFESLSWQLGFSKLGGRYACPDILVPDAHFVPLLHSEEVLAAYLKAEELQQRGLTLLVKALLTR